MRRPRNRVARIRKPSTLRLTGLHTDFVLSMACARVQRLVTPHGMKLRHELQPRCRGTSNASDAPRESCMAEYDVNSIPGLIRGLLEDARDLIREEIALARAEIREEISAAQTVAVALGNAALAAFLGAVMLCITLGGAIAYFLNWPTWGGYGVVTHCS